MILIEDERYIGGDRKRGLVQHADRVIAGFTRANLAELFAAEGHRKGAEIGVADGRNALTLCRTIPGLHLLCVDPWRPYSGNRRGGPLEQHEQNFTLAQDRLKAFDVTFYRMHSADAAELVPLDSLDFVYIDGNHAREFVYQDLVLWGARVRRGGIIAGHDFYEFDGAGVIEAVEQYTAEQRIEHWRICDEREPSFFWMKP